MLSSGIAFLRISAVRCFVRRVHVRMHEADRDRLDAVVLEPRDLGGDRRLVEGQAHLAVHVDALRHGEAQRARHQRLRLLDGEIVLVVAALGRDIERVAKSIGRDQRGARAAPLDDRVGRERGAVDEHVDVGEMQAGIAEHQPRARQHALLGPRRGQHLAGDPLGPRSSTTSVNVPPISTAIRTSGRDIQVFRSSRAIRNSISAIASFESLMPGLRCASLAIAPRRFRMYLRTASPSIPGCCS